MNQMVFSGGNTVSQRGIKGVGDPQRGNLTKKKKSNLTNKKGENEKTEHRESESHGYSKGKG